MSASAALTPPLTSPLSPPASTASTRVIWVDYAKAGAITLVVFGHVLRGLWSAKITPETVPLHQLDNWNYAFNRHLFFFLSGLWALRALAKPANSTFLTRLKVLAWPYLLWATLQTLAQALTPGANNPTSLADLWRILYLPPMQFWFLYALFVIATAYELLIRLVKNPWIPVALWAVAWHFQEHLHLHWPVAFQSMQYFGVYALGAALAVHLTPQRLPAWTLAAIALTTGTALTLVIRAGYDPEATGIWTFQAIGLLGIAMACAIAKLLAHVYIPLLTLLGQATLAIFVAHTIICAAVRLALVKGLHTHNLLLHLTLGTIAGLGLPLLLYILAQRPGWQWLLRWPTRTPRAA